MEEITPMIEQIYDEPPAVTLLYGEATDWVFECQGLSDSHENLPSDYSHLENTVCIKTNIKRANSLPDAVYGLM